MSDREQQIQNRLDRTLNPDDGVFLDGWFRTSVPDLRYLLDLLATERQRADGLELDRNATESCRLKDNQYLLDQLRAERQARAALEQVGSALVSKLDECIPHIANAFVLRMVHGAQYRGPNFAAELEALRALLHGAKGDRP